MTNKMDYQFPQQLFPTFYNSGPPDSALKHCAGNWGSYDRVRLQGGSGPLSSWTCTSRHQVRGETWRHTEPVPVPLLPPKYSVLWPSKPPEPMDFQEHMQNFFVDHCQEAFGCMGEILGENFSFREGQRKKHGRDSVNIWKVKNFLDKLKFKKCHVTYSSKTLDAYSTLMSDVVQTVPPELLGTLLYEELTEQRDRMLFFEGATGGALAFIPFSQSSSSSSQRGCLLYPGNKGLDCLNFHRVELQHHGGSSCVDSSSSDPFRFHLKGPIRQISATSLFNDCCVAVRSDYLCGVWRFSEIDEPRLLQVVNTKEVATCVSVSPHVLGEVLVVSESGAANLWTVGRGMQKVREEDHNLYFNAKSSWRWCEFSAHPRVMLYADRTGVELTDIRVNPVLGHTLFRISHASECRSGERLILSRYLGDTHSFHHLITTQHSAYIMDERFPSVPMLKWDHMMLSPPMFCHVIPGTCSTKVMLGSYSSQEITLLQYSGGRAEACFSRGPPQSLHRPRDSLKHLPVQIPHRLDTANNRLSSPATGLTCIQKKGGGGECICILQLTEVGDIFYQILEPEQPGASGAPAAQDEAPPQPTRKEAAIGGRKPLQPASQLVISDTSSDEGVIQETQGLSMQWFVPETPEKEVRVPNRHFDSSSEDSASEGNGPYLKKLGLQVFINNPEQDEVNGLYTVREDGNVCKNNTENTEKPAGLGENLSVSHMTQVGLSDSTLVTWKHWLQKLMRKSHKKEFRSHTQHMTVNTGGLQLSDDEARDQKEEERVQSLRRDLRACMAKRSLLVHSDVSASLGAPGLVPLPNLVEADAWTDALSQRLTVSWQGEEAWQAWWKEKLGLNREEKVEALKRKRRREKEAKRATGRRLELSGSFTSSVSYQSELDNFSDSMGWSSAASQGAWSEAESIESQFPDFEEHGTPRSDTPSTQHSHTLVSTLAATPQSIKDVCSDQQTPSCLQTLPLSQTPKPDSTPTTRRRTKRPDEDYLSSLFAPQDEPSQHDSYFLEEGTTVRLPPVASSSQLRGSQSVSQNVFRVDLSQDTPDLVPFSQSLSQSQSSQGRLRSSQASQSKKRSRMGF